MSTKTPALSGGPSTDDRAGRARGRREAAHRGEEHRTNQTIALSNSVVTVEDGPAGTVLRIDRVDVTDYAGPVPEATVDALREVGENVS